MTKHTPGPWRIERALLALRAGYFQLLQLPHDTLRLRSQRALCLLRDAIAEAEGRTAEEVQDEYEALACANGTAASSPTLCAIHRIKNCKDCQAGEEAAYVEPPTVPPTSPLTIEDLVAYEQDIRTIASGTQVNLHAIIAWALKDVNDSLDMTLADAAVASGDMGAWASAKDVVPTDALKLWQTFLALALLFESAYNAGLTDKYLLKWKEYRALTKWARGLYFNIGVGVATSEEAKASGLPNRFIYPAGMKEGV